MSLTPQTGIIPDSQIPVAPVKVGQVFVDPTRTGELNVFFVRGPSTNYYFKNGGVAEFKPGIVPGHEECAFITEVKGYADELKMQIAQGHPIFFQKEGLEIVSETQLDPLANVREQAIKEFQQKLLAAAGNSEEAKKLLNAMGVGTPENSETPDAKPALSGIANSFTVAEGMAGSDSTNAPAGPAASPLAALLKK